MKFNVVCFGGATYDNYLLSDEFSVIKKEKGKMLCQMYGAKIEIKESIITTGGGATNAAVCFERLGLQAGLVCCVGRDFWGRAIREKLTEEGVSPLYIQITEKAPTSSSVFLVGNDGGRTVLVYRAASNLLSKNKIDWNRLDSDWVYVSSLGGDFELLEKIVWFCRKKRIKMFFNPGGRELKKNKQLCALLKYVDILSINKEELDVFLGENEDSIEDEEVFGIGSSIVLVTRGRMGADAFYNNKKYHQKIIENKTVEETGAGDAFGASFVAGQIMGLTIEKSLLLASNNASSVVGKIGPKEGLLFWPEAKKLINIG